VSSLQALDVVVIYDKCEVCKRILRVLRSGHLEDHKYCKNRRWRECDGSGMLALAVVKINRADNRETKKDTRNRSIV
jgi:hypothetical protein